MQMTESRKPRRRKSRAAEWGETQDRMLREQNDRIEYLNRAYRHRALVLEYFRARYGSGAEVRWYSFGLSLVTDSGTTACAPTLRGLRSKADQGRAQ